MMLKAVTGSVFAWVLFLVPVASLAQVPGTNDPDYKEIVTYRLTVPALNKVIQATRNLATALKSDPRFLKAQSLQVEIKKLEEKAELSEADSAKLERLQADLEKLEESAPSSRNARTLSDMEAQFKKEPAFAKALADASLAPREYAKFMLAYFQAALLSGMMKAGLVKEAPQAELAAFAKEMELLGAKGKQ